MGAPALGPVATRAAETFTLALLLVWEALGMPSGLWFQQIHCSDSLWGPSSSVWSDNKESKGAQKDNRWVTRTRGNVPLAHQAVLSPLLGSCALPHLKPILIHPVLRVYGVSVLDVPVYSRVGIWRLGTSLGSLAVWLLPSKETKPLNPAYSCLL